MKLFRKKGAKGFTLIELLIVVAILGILAAVIIPNVATFMATGTLNAARTEAENVKTAALAFYADNGFYPGTSANLTIGNNLKADYITSAAKGVYTFNMDTGVITGADKGTWSAAITWDTATNTWKK